MPEISNEIGKPPSAQIMGFVQLMRCKSCAMFGMPLEVVCLQAAVFTKLAGITH